MIVTHFWPYCDKNPCVIFFMKRFCVHVCVCVYECCPLELLCFHFAALTWKWQRKKCIYLDVKHWVLSCRQWYRGRQIEHSRGISIPLWAPLEISSSTSDFRKTLFASLHSTLWSIRKKIEFFLRKRRLFVSFWWKNRVLWEKIEDLW